ncbi:hypothetical protein SUGI_0943360 [Cryptomeria japonica]|nr:hypothetical protein SUGI_0943360 [Cryptomeria japonica]
MHSPRGLHASQWERTHTSRGSCRGRQNKCFQSAVGFSFANDRLLWENGRVAVRVLVVPLLNFKDNIEVFECRS